MVPLNLELIDQAVQCLKGKIRKTPLEPSPLLSEWLSTPVSLKLESQQITGSFKVRGALFYLSTLNEEQKRKGVAACSAGNHGLGIAYASQIEGMDCTIYLPKNVDQAKYEKIVKLGARVIRSEFNGYDDTLAWAENEVKKTGQIFISAFEDERIMAGNGGTLAFEILEEMPDVDNVIFPVGGGGLGAGLSYYFKMKRPSIRLIGCQHIDSPAFKLSLERGQAVTALDPIETIAGGIEGGIGKRCFEILQTKVQEVILVTEKEIEEAFCWMLEHHHQLVEPSAVVTIAGCLFHIPGGVEESGIGQGGSPDFLAGARGRVPEHGLKRGRKIWGKANEVQNRLFNHERYTLPRLQGKTVVLLSGRNVAYTTLQRVVFRENLYQRRN